MSIGAGRIMHVCSQCGAEVADGAQFCSACGRRLAPGENSEIPLAPEPPLPRRHRGQRVVLVFLGIVVVAAILFGVGMVYSIRHTTIITATKNGGRVESPIGVVTTDNDPAKLAKTLGLEPFPGAAGEKGAQAELAANTMVSLTFRTSASPRQVIGFYHVRYPDATVSAQGKQITLVLVSLRDTLTIKAIPESGHTEIEISDIRH